METTVKTFIIPNELCRRAGVAASWLSINELGVFGHQKIVSQVDKPSAFAPSDASVFQLRQDIILFKPILRKLVNEANGTFLNVQNLTATASEHKPELLKMSRQYRSIVRACLENLQDEVMRANGDYREELQNYITIFYSVECIWHLCEILFVDAVPGNIVLPHLLDWVRFHFPKYERNAATMLSGDLGGLESHPDYWETVIGSLLQGRIKVARALLKLHSDAETQPFKVVDQCLRAMPVYNMFSGTSVAEFNMQWNHWVVDVQSKIDAKLFISCYNLNLIMKLAVGDEIAWGEIQQYCEAWYELLAAWLFFTQPTVKSFELGQLAKQCITKMSIGNRIKHLDRVLLAAMEFDVLQVIKEVQHMTENGWFVCHLTDLLYHAGRLSDLNVESENFQPEKLRESFLIDYGTLLMGHKSLWQVGLSYLDHCPQDGLEVTKLLLPRLPLDSELRTQKIVREAINRNLPETAQSICKVQGMVCKNRGRLGHALAWALKSQDSAFVSYLADKFLRQYSESGNLTNADLLDNLGSCILASDRLIFLGKYFEFHKLYRAKEYKEAASLLISLLESKIIPNYFWGILLTETVPLLECEEMVFSSTDTFTIMQCLEEREHLKELKDKIALSRLAATRNLARALVHEAQLN
ncbi:nuclear pore complex protein Nup85 [Asbolus verrucosus]|uniref:Nuclear pore complex protein Nup85 n=1 Tax=Asbolus verrucosus TaxID=1661398 RepID=A0A482VPT5_ASBVE|nr:nuclear pore complex protein Nup85 [Asbolus verrucosus]